MAERNEQQTFQEKEFERVFSEWVKSHPMSTDIVALKALVWPFFKEGYVSASKNAFKYISQQIHVAARQICGTD